MIPPDVPPKYGSWAELVAPIKQGETGWRVYGLQIALLSLSRSVTLDCDFGPKTKAAVQDFQEHENLEADGIAGPVTQRRILTKLGARTHAQLPDVPDGLMRGFAEGEGASVLAATNWTVAGGVDCGCMQYRVFGPPYDRRKLEIAFDPVESMLEAAGDFLARTVTLGKGSWVSSQLRSLRPELAKRLAVLAHNWPAGALDYAARGSVNNPTGIATWVAAGTKFPDGTAVTTRGQWAEFYAMGGRHGEGAITKYVTDWT